MDSVKSQFEQTAHRALTLLVVSLPSVFIRVHLRLVFLSHRWTLMDSDKSPLEQTAHRALKLLVVSPSSAFIRVHLRLIV